MMAIGKDFKNYLVLISFLEKEKYSVARLRDVITTKTAHHFQGSVINFTWNPEEVVEVPWTKALHPAKFLQFGSKKNIVFSFICLKCLICCWLLL